MLEKKETGPLQPVVKKHRGPSMVWLIPLVTLIAGGLLIVKYISERGPKITITFRTADGVEKKTPIKYKDVQIGVVKKIRFSKDFNHVVLIARMASSAEPFLREGTRFWVVRPHLSLHGASGLSTLLSGSYIEVDPGKGQEKYNFLGQEEAPAITSDADGLRITLTSERLGSLDIGAPVYYRGIPAGKILNYDLGSDRKSVLINAFIKPPFNALVHDNSHFWNISGINASVDGGGFRLHSQSILTMIFGGIAFDSPLQTKKNTELSSKTFRLYAHYDDILESSYRQKLKFITFFPGSVHGLDIGAIVEFRGIRIGRVIQIGMDYNNRDHSFRIPVTLEIEPERMPNYGRQDEKQMRQIFTGLIRQGLRTQLQTSSLLTGKLYVALFMHPDDVPPRLIGDGRSGLPEIPSIPGGFDQMKASLQGILTKLARVRTDKIGDDLQNVMHGARTLINAPGFGQSVQDLHASLAAFRQIIESLDENTAADHLDEILIQAKKTLVSLNRVLNPASPMQSRLNHMSRDLSDMARSIRSFVELLDRHPNAIIFGKPKTGE